MKEWLTIKQAMGRFDYSSRTSLYKLLKKHKVTVSTPTTKGKVFVKESELMAIFDAKAFKMGV